MAKVLFALRIEVPLDGLTVSSYFRDFTAFETMKVDLQD
jgi:hypothetical protein